MWKVELVDILGNGLIVGFNTCVDTLAEAEIIAANEIKKHLQTDDIQLAHETDLIYEVWQGESSIGVVTIRSI